MCQLSNLAVEAPPTCRAYLGMLEVPSLENLNHALLLLGCAEFILQSSLAC